MQEIILTDKDSDKKPDEKVNIEVERTESKGWKLAIVLLNIIIALLLFLLWLNGPFR